VIGSQDGGRGILAQWVFSRRGEGGVSHSGSSVTPMRSEEEATGSGAWHGAQARGVRYSVTRRREGPGGPTVW
jgi:hypothetical protein